MNEEQQMHQEIPQPTIDQLILGLMWELQQVRLSNMALKESIDGLIKAVQE